MLEEKRAIKPGTLLFPNAVVLVSCSDGADKDNIITIGWPGGIGASPPRIGIPIKRQRYSHGLICKTREFVVNIPTSDQMHAINHCGTVSGRNHDKYLECKLDRVAPTKLRFAPSIGQCPISLECRVEAIWDMGSHDYFVGRIVIAHVAENWLGNDNRVQVRAEQLVALVSGNYYRLSEEQGRSTYS